jgi:hypothetical protein
MQKGYFLEYFLIKRIFLKKLSKLKKTACEVWLQNVIKGGKYSPGILPNLYTFVLRVNIT